MKDIKIGLEEINESVENIKEKIIEKIEGIKKVEEQDIQESYIVKKYNIEAEMEYMKGEEVLKDIENKMREEGYRVYLSDIKKSIKSYYMNKEKDLKKEKKNFIRIQRHDYAYRDIIEKDIKDKTIRRLIRKEYKERKLKKGALLNCDNCKTYEAAKIIFNIDITIDIIKNRIDIVPTIREVKCSNCNTILTDEDYYFVNYNKYDGNKPLVLLKTIDIFDNEDKIILAIVNKEVKCFLDQYRVEYYSEKIVFNLKTGRTYRLPGYNLKTKKTRDNLMSLSEESFGVTLEKIKITDKIYYQMVEKINSYFEKNSIKYVDLKENINYSMNTCFNGNRIISINYLKDLISYNYNPSLQKEERKMIGFCRRMLPLANKIKKTRNEEFINIVHNKYGITNKYHKIFFNRAILEQNIKLVNKNHFKESIKVIEDSVKDNNNRIKIYKNLSYGNIDIVTTDFYKELIKRYKENNVVNAICKYVVSNKMYIVNDSARMYQEIKNIIPEYEIPNKRLRMKDIHDKLSSDYNKIKTPEIIYVYDEKMLECYEKEIDGITFKVAKGNYELTNIGSKMNICVGSYSRRVELGYLFIVSMSNKEDDYLGCLEISKDSVLHQAKAPRNNRLSEEYQEILSRYCKEAMIDTDTYDLNDKYNKINNKGSKSYLNKKGNCCLERLEISQDDRLNILKKMEEETPRQQKLTIAAPLFREDDVLYDELVEF